MASHGHSKGRVITPTYSSWRTMKNRHKEYHAQYTRYSQAPICDRWLDFSNFLLDMGERPEGTTLERIDNSKGYEPSNCRWATVREQNRNKTTTLKVVVDGREMLLIDYCRENSLNYRTIWGRMNTDGMSFQEAITKPIRKSRS